MIDIDHDRRESPRIALSRPCKVFNPRSGKYVGGSTCDVSSGGMLLRLDRPLAVEMGDRVYVGVAQKRRQALLRGDDMVETTVVRKLTTEAGEMLAGVRYADPGRGLVVPTLQRAA